MRILFLHNIYQQTGGEDSVVANEEALRRNHGQKVHLHRVSNDTIQDFWSKVVTGWLTPYSLWEKQETSKILNKFWSNVLHVHNFFPLRTPFLYDASQGLNEVIDDVNWAILDFMAQRTEKRHAQ